MIKFRDDLHGCENVPNTGGIILHPINDDPYHIGLAYHRYRVAHLSKGECIERNTDELLLLLSQYYYGRCVRYELASYLETQPIHVEVERKGKN